MSAMAATAGPAIFLGERPDAAAPADYPAADQDTAQWRAGSPAQRATLTALAASIQHAAGDVASFAEADLPAALRCRTALQVLARRAHRSGKQVALSRCSPQLRAL